MSKLNPKRFLLEIFSIIFAVLLALALDSWRENIKEQRIIDRALADIFEEVQDMNSLAGSLGFNKKALEELDSALLQYEKGLSTNLSAGLARPEIRNIAWITAKENGIAAGFDHDLFKDLVEVYTEFDRLEVILDYSREFSLKSDPDMSDYTYARHNRRQLQQTIFRCEELLRKANQFLGNYKDSKYAQFD